MSDDVAQLNPEIETAVNGAYERVNKLLVKEGITKSEFNKLDEMCPKTMIRLREIEDIVTGKMTPDEAKGWIEKWEKNWCLVVAIVKNKRAEKEKAVTAEGGRST